MTKIDPKKDATLVQPNGVTRPVQPVEDGRFSMEELYKLLETDLVEVIKLADGFIMIVDEEGKFKQSKMTKFNQTATMIVNAWGHSGYIVGDALVCRKTMFPK